MQKSFDSASHYVKFCKERKEDEYILKKLTFKQTNNQKLNNTKDKLFIIRSHKCLMNDIYRVRIQYTYQILTI